MPLLNRDNVFDTKGPTCVLFDNNKKFHSFGNDAEDNYLEYSQDGEQGNYYFFRGFKRRFPNNMVTSILRLETPHWHNSNKCASGVLYIVTLTFKKEK